MGYEEIKYEEYQKADIKSKENPVDFTENQIDDLIEMFNGINIQFEVQRGIASWWESKKRNCKKVKIELYWRQYGIRTIYILMTDDEWIYVYVDINKKVGINTITYNYCYKCDQWGGLKELVSKLKEDYPICFPIT
jgi:hypothetical protein